MNDKMFEDIVVAKDLAIQLWENDIKIESHFAWYCDAEDDDEPYVILNADDPKEYELLAAIQMLIPAPTLEEVMRYIYTKGFYIEESHACHECGYIRRVDMKHPRATRKHSTVNTATAMADALVWAKRMWEESKK